MKQVPKQSDKAPRPLWLLRRWKRAAGPLAGRFVMSAPFTALELYGEPRGPIAARPNPAALDAICQRLAERLSQTEQLAAVQSGEAAFVIDLPGPLSVGLGYYLQAYGVAPVLLFNGLFRPGAVLEGLETLPAISRYSSRLKPWQAGSGYAFLLERDRTGPEQIDDLTLCRVFDNRYHAGEHLFPPFEELTAQGLAAFIDLRLEGDDLPDEMDSLYRQAARAGLDVYQANLPRDWFVD
ncbi:MAG TPA: hypothetical protein VH186_32055 [Chloroflexia bacterium]|nr:hypothetical protein [Chloroflexia bacterium]